MNKGELQGNHNYQLSTFNSQLSTLNFQLSFDNYQSKHGFGRFAPKAVLFDMDGVIYDSMGGHSVSWHDAMAAEGISMEYADAYRFEGMRGVETIRLLARQQWHRDISDSEAAAMYARKAQAFAAYCMQHPVSLMPGIRKLMQQLKDDGMKICVVTGSAQKALLDRLHSDLQGLVSEELTVTALDVAHGKPAPEPYLKGMQKCGLEAWECIVVENAPLGVRAAVAARCFTIAANTGPLADDALAAEGADIIFPSIAALSRQWPEFKKAL